MEMKLERIGAGLRQVAILCAAGLAAACSSGEQPASGKSIVLLSVETGPGARPGSIRGEVRCGDEDMPAPPPCLPDDLPLAEAVLACGPVQATIDRGASHRLLVKFPAGTSERFPALPADVDIVRCVRSRVGFSFSAGLATDSDEVLEGNPAPFRILHSGRPAEKRAE